MAAVRAGQTYTPHFSATEMHLLSVFAAMSLTDSGVRLKACIFSLGQITKN